MYSVLKRALHASPELDIGFIIDLSPFFKKKHLVLAVLCHLLQARIFYNRSLSRAFSSFAYLKLFFFIGS